MKDIIIVGAGLAGSVHAILMAKKGYNVKVFERRPDLRNVELKGGRSINLALSTRGLKALELAGVKEEIESICIPMYGRKMHDIKGNLTFQSYGKEDEAINSVSRGDLNKRLLLNATEYKNVSFFFNHKCEDIDLKTNTAHFTDEHNNQVSHTADYIFGTDGAFSAVRLRMMKTDRFDFSQMYLGHGYKEILLPANEDGTHKLEKNALHIWPRGQYMLIALPNFDGSYTCTLFFPYEGKPSFNSLQTPEAVNDFFKNTFPDFYELMPDLAEEYFKNPTASLVTVKCNPWNNGNQTLIFGDAAHAIVPFYGQGMNASFEDCSVFYEMLEANDDNMEKTIVEFAAKRKPDGDAIAQLALDNYIEMRDLVADESFLLRKKIENKIYEKHPEKWMPLYSQVTFSHIPYSVAYETGQKQKRIMDKIMNQPDIKQKWDSPEVEQQILNALDV